MKLLLPIGAPLISAAPVQAFEPYKELIKARMATEGNRKLCVGLSMNMAAFASFNLLCCLEGEGIVDYEFDIIIKSELAMSFDD